MEISYEEWRSFVQDAQDASKEQSRTDKSRCSNLLRGKEVVSVILFHDEPYSVRRIEPLQHCQEFLDDPTLLSSPDMVQSNVSPGAFTHLMEILDGAEPHFSQETVDGLILLAQEFGRNSLIATLVPQRDVPRHEEMYTTGSACSDSRRSPEARPDSTTRSGNGPHRSRGRRSDSDFCPSHRDDGNRTLNEELAVTRF
jgi:hypothetical protein